MEHVSNYSRLFTNVKPHTVEGIKIYDVDDSWYVDQNYSAIPEEEHVIWSRLFTKQKEFLNYYASKEYLEGLTALNLIQRRLPEFRYLSRKMRAASGWQLIPVAGFLDEEVFFSLNAAKKFPATVIIRGSHRFRTKYSNGEIKNEDGYTPEPDIYHDVRGHAPFLMNREYGNFLAKMGDIGVVLIKDDRKLGSELVSHNLKRLQNFAWWTYEFGVMKKQLTTDLLRQRPNDIKFEIYGAGIISSLSEVTNVVACAKGESRKSQFIPFNIEEVMLTRFDYSDIQDRYFVIDSMESLYSEFYSNRELFFYEG